MKLLVLASYAQSGVSAGRKFFYPQVSGLGTAGRPQRHAQAIPSSLETCSRGLQYIKSYGSGLNLQGGSFQEKTENVLYAVVACLEWTRRIAAGLWTMAVDHSLLRLKPELQKRLRALLIRLRKTSRLRNIFLHSKDCSTC